MCKIGKNFTQEKAMEYARVGSNGMKVSRICLGCMGFGDAERWVYKWLLEYNPMLAHMFPWIASRKALPVPVLLPRIVCHICG
jgi:hypothetical protein